MSSTSVQKTKQGEKNGIFSGPPFYALYLAIFLFSFHFALPLYINSSFLETFFSGKLIGFIYAAGALLTLGVLSQFPRALKAIGNLRVVLILLVLEALALISLAFFQTAIFILPSFIAMQILVSLILFNFDVFFESFSIDQQTGTIRGVMLTVLNTAILLGPITAGIILTNGDYFRVYLISAVLLFPVFSILWNRLRNFKDPDYEKIPYLKTLHKIVFVSHPKDDIRHVVLANLVMRFFFSWMVIYMPIYLHETIGFNWSEIGIIFTIMLLPFVLFEAPIGRFVDMYKNEKMIMVMGFLVAASFTAMIPFIESSTIFVWALILFGTRVGMSFVEITSESYFFKHIAGDDTNILAVFRNTRPIAYILGPAIASIFLFFISIQYLFLILTVILFYGAWNSSIMRDTKI